MRRMGSTGPNVHELASQMPLELAHRFPDLKFDGQLAEFPVQYRSFSHGPLEVAMDTR